MKKLIFPLALIAAFSLSSCGGGGKDTKEVAEEQNDSTFDDRANEKDLKQDADAMVKAASLNMWEIQLSEAVLPALVTKEAKDLAQMMIDAHKKAGDKAMALAAEKQITLPAALTQDEVDKINKIKEDNKGIELDKKFTDQMVEDHKKTIDHFEKSADKCEDAAVKSFFSDMLPELRNHLTHAESAKEAVKDRKK